MKNPVIKFRIISFSCFLVTWVLVFLCSPARCEQVATSPVFAGSSQLVIVTTGGWDEVSGKLQRYSRKDVNAPWKRVGSVIPVVVGKSGLGWGRGINPVITDDAGPQKKEGDGRGPAGIFKLGDAFGLAPKSEMPGLKLPYLQLNPETECVDDVKSTHYNSIVGDVRARDWDSSEHMKNVGAQYRLGVVVEHNFEPRVNGGGSCIFMHVWKDSGTGTSGCTAMSSEAMDGFITWLEPKAKPLLVQLPKAKYKVLKKQWGLP